MANNKQRPLPIGKYGAMANLHDLSVAAVLRSKERRVTDDEIVNKQIKEQPQQGPEEEPSNDDKKRPAADADGSRKKKRTTEWPLEQHRRFISVIYDIGVLNASPSIVLENMTDPPRFLTSERVKSRLQKFRHSKEKGKEEFLQAFDKWMENPLFLGDPGEMGVRCGEMVGALVHGIMEEEEDGDPASVAASQQQQSLSNFQQDPMDDYMKMFTRGGKLSFPALSESERKSALGHSLVGVSDLLTKLKYNLLDSRIRNRAARLSEEVEVKQQGPALQLDAQEQNRGAALPDAHSKAPPSLLETDQQTYESHVEL